MLKVKTVLTFFLVLYLFLFSAGKQSYGLFTSPVLAGGQLVNLVADSNAWINNNGEYGRIMRVFLNPDFPCKDTAITFKFVEPKDGDYINTGSGSPTYTMQEDRQPFYQNGVLKGSTCGTYAKMSSKIKGDRLVTVEVRNGNNVWKESPVIKVAFDGQYHADSSYNNENYRSSFDNYGWYIDPNFTSPDSTQNPLPAGKPSFWLLNQQKDAPYGRKVTIKYGWDQALGNIHYNIYTKLIYKGDNDWQKVISADKGPSSVLQLRSDVDYQIKVEGCLDKVGTCVSSNELSLPKLSSQNPPLQGAPEMVYPQNGQTLDLEGTYMFKVKPVNGASGYLFGLFQDDKMIYENYRDTKQLSLNGEFALLEDNPAHANFHAGNMKVMIRALVNGNWTEAQTINIVLKPRSGVLPSVAPTEQPKPTQASASSAQYISAAATDSSALQRQIDELQKKLEASQARQSALENRLSQIIAWIKSIFPFSNK